GRSGSRTPWPGGIGPPRPSSGAASGRRVVTVPMPGAIAWVGRAPRPAAWSRAVRALSVSLLSRHPLPAKLTTDPLGLSIGDRHGLLSPAALGRAVRGLTATLPAAVAPSGPV